MVARPLALFTKACAGRAMLDHRTISRTIVVSVAATTSPGEP